MAIKLKQSTASQEIPLGYFLDSTNGDSEETTLTIANTDIKVWKTGATTLANKNSGGATHISNGIYYCVLDATDTNTLGPMVIFVHVSGALAVRVECEVVTTNVYDSSFSTDKLEVDVVQVSGDSTSADNLELDYDGTGYAKTNSTVGTCTTNTDMLTAAAVNAEVVDVIRTDPSSEPAQGAPDTTPTIETMIKYIYFRMINKTVTTSSENAMYDVAGTTKVIKTTISDNGSTFTKNAYISG